MPDQPTARRLEPSRRPDTGLAVGIFDDPASARNKRKISFRSFPTLFAFGTRVAIPIGSTWFHKPIKGAVQRYSGPAHRPFLLVRPLTGRPVGRSRSSALRRDQLLQ